MDHLKEFGLTTKPPELLGGGAVLGFKLKRGKMSELVFRRGKIVLQVTGEMVRWELFSVCGKLLGHYLIAGWLQPACHPST